MLHLDPGVLLPVLSGACLPGEYDAGWDEERQPSRRPCDAPKHRGGHRLETLPLDTMKPVLGFSIDQMTQALWIVNSPRSPHSLGVGGFSLGSVPAAWRGSNRPHRSEGSGLPGDCLLWAAPQKALIGLISSMPCF